MSGTGEPNTELNPSGTDTAAEIAALKAEISDLRIYVS